MHEYTMIHQLMSNIASIAEGEGAKKVRCLKLKLGAMLEISAEHFQEHFNQVAKGSIAEDALLILDRSEDPYEPDAQAILIEMMEIDC
ncbi:MAG: hydrogenase/urease maturation nickel metallochaperone HypA [Oligoflexus sp.]